MSVVVVAYRQREPLARCLASIATAAQRVPDGVELIVVDNGGLAPLVREHAPAARVIEPGSNVGFAAGVARAIESARGAWIALVNDDARVQPDALAALLEAGERDERIGSVAAQVRFENAPDHINSAGIGVDSLGIAAERLAGRPVADADAPAAVFGASASVALYRAAMLRAIGGFDARFFAYLEDVDVAWRARAAGWGAVYEPTAVAHHVASASSGEGSAAKYFLIGRNRVRLLARNATAGQLLRALPGIALYDTAYVLFVAFSDRTLAPLRGRVAGLREWRTLRRETRSARRPVALRPARSGWLDALRMRRAYRRAGA